MPPRPTPTHTVSTASRAPGHHGRQPSQALPIAQQEEFLQIVGLGAGAEGKEQEQPDGGGRSGSSPGVEQLGPKLGDRSDRLARSPRTRTSAKVCESDGGRRP